MKQDSSIPAMIRLTYTGDELDAWLQAWNTFPTYTTDCQAERRLKDWLRKARVKKLLSKLEVQ